jgi:hypothetical protein
MYQLHIMAEQVACLRNILGVLVYYLSPKTTYAANITNTNYTNH